MPKYSYRPSGFQPRLGCTLAVAVLRLNHARQPRCVDTTGSGGGAGDGATGSGGGGVGLE